MRVTKEDLHREFLLKNILPQASQEEIDSLGETKGKELVNYLNGQSRGYYKITIDKLIMLVKLVSFEQGRTSDLGDIEVNYDMISINNGNSGKYSRLSEDRTESVRELFPYKYVEEISEADYDTVLVNFEKVLNYE